LPNKKRVLVTAKVNYSQYCLEAKELLEANGFEVIENSFGRPFSTSELINAIQDADAAIAGADRWDDAILKAAPCLKIIARFGVGVDNIDLIKAKEYGIKVTNARGGNANGVAELAIGMIFAALRHEVYLHNSLRKGHWVGPVGVEISGKNVGLLGFGDIAQRVAKKLSGFDVDVYAFDKYPNFPKAKELGVKMVGMEEILRDCDIVSLHLPSSKETYHIMDRERFAMMKDGSYFINTARGVLVDEKALYEALKTKKLAAAAIDVYEEEPTKPTNPLFTLDNITCTPHTASETYETFNLISMITAQAILDVFQGKTPKNLVNG
jgi:D-3-phosphoglycerate dehydrogenase